MDVKMILSIITLVFLAAALILNITTSRRMLRTISLLNDRVEKLETRVDATRSQWYEIDTRLAIVEDRVRRSS